MNPLDAARAAVVRCRLCPRLVEYRERVAREKKAAFRGETYWGRPLPGFGDPAARLLLVGLAPAAHGGNRTGRMFTGDSSGDFLFASMHRTGFASVPWSRSSTDGLELRDAYIVAAVRCAPPDNRPTPEEIVTCRRHLRAETAALPRVRVVLALGRIGFEAYLAYRRLELGKTDLPGGGRPRFAHGVRHDLGDVILLASYHPSRQNTNTGKLTPDMLDAVFRQARNSLR